LYAGFYEYDDDGTIIRPDVDPLVEAEPAQRVHLAEPSETLNILLHDLGVSVLEEDDGMSPILADPIGEDCTALVQRLKLDAKRLIAIDTQIGRAHV